MGKSDALIALQRFGLGPRPGDLATIGSQARDWLLAQIVGHPQKPRQLSTLPPVTERLAAIKQDRQQRKERKQGDGDEQTIADTGKPQRRRKKLGNVGDGDAAGMSTTDAAAKPVAGNVDGLRKLYIDDAGRRSEALIASDTPLADRLVQFWSNHFTVSGQRPVVAPLALPFEEEAIRPHIFGRFSDMLLASTRHPAMLLYLDNAQSVGPLSRFGAQRQRGLNENFARELMELHTLGVDGGYSQNDVREVAKVLTGWTIAGLGAAKPRRALFANPAPDDSGAIGFRFLAAAHEPGDKTVLSKNYPEAGEDEGRILLETLARHPATAKRIAIKFARHFIDDDPSDAIVQSLAKTYLDSDGDLAALTRKLIETDAAWQIPARKIRTPNDWVVASFRMLQATGDDLGKRCIVALRQLGQLPFMAPSPAGWSDKTADWLSPDALMTKIDLARVTARRAADDLDPRKLVSEIIGPDVSPETAFQINNAPSKFDALALLMVSPEFLRR